MAQQLKDEVRERMLDAAATVFADAGYGGATMAAIAREAGISTGNLYRYFGNKEELFSTVVTDSFADELLSLLHQRVSSLVRASELTDLDAQATADGDALLRFWIEHRAQVIVLLDRADGTRFEDFAAHFVAALMEPTLAHLRERSGRARLPKLVRFTLENIFANTVRTIVAILEEYRSERRIREAFQAFWSYQLAGLAGLQEWVSDE